MICLVERGSGVDQVVAFDIHQAVSQFKFMVHVITGERRRQPGNLV